MKTAMKLNAIIAAGIITTIPTVSALADNAFAFARFDSEKTVALQGTVEEFQWTNPHVLLLLTVEEKGRPRHWTIEMNGVSGLARQGWTPKTLVPGMPVKAIIHPLRDGTKGGQFLGVVLPNGTVLGQQVGVP
jgi:hypothetical protein